MNTGIMWRAATLGAVSGGRSQLAVAAVSLTTPAGERSRPASALAGRWTKATLTGTAVGELCVDKYPGTPSRLSPAGLTPRLLLGALAAASLAARRHEPRLAPATVAAVTALAGAVVGSRWRAAVQRRGAPDWPTALAEDLVVLTLAVIATAPAQKPAG